MSKPIRDEIAGLAEGKGSPIIDSIVKYNLKCRKADVAGRLSGGIFTNYASTGGRLGNSRLSPNAKRTRMVTNFGISSYGAAIKAIAQGMQTYQAVIQSILTGKPEHIVIKVQASAGYASSDEEKALLAKLTLSISEALPLFDVHAPPVQINEFCSRPENMNLKGLCR